MIQVTAPFFMPPWVFSSTKMNIHTAFAERHDGGCRWLCFCCSQVLLEGVAVHSNFLLELCSAHCSTGCLWEPSLSGRLEMWKDKLQTSGWTSKMWIVLSLIKSIQQGVVCSISLFFEDWNEFRWQEILPVCQRTAGCQRILEKAKWLFAFAPGYS